MTIQTLTTLLIQQAGLSFNGVQSTVAALHSAAKKSHNSKKTKFRFSPIATKKGSKWITGEKRAAFYIAGNFTCAYCGDAYEYHDLSLDHIITRETNGQVLQFLAITSNTALSSQIELVKSAKNGTGQTGPSWSSVENSQPV